MDNIPIRNIPLIGTMINKERSHSPSNQEQIAVRKLFDQFTQELENKEELLQQFDSFSSDLVRMGYDPKFVLRIFIVHQYTSLEEAVEILGKTDDLWNHKFINCYEDRCFICNEYEDQHRTIKNILKKKSLSQHSSSVESEKIKSLLRRINTSEVQKEEYEEDEGDEIKTQCPICLSGITSKTFSLECQHSFCLECVISYLEEEIKNSRVKQIKCPQKECEESFPEETIKSFVNNESYDRYSKFKERLIISDDQNVITCPISDCEGYAKRNVSSKDDGDNHVLIEIDNPEKKLLSKENIKEAKIKYICNKDHHFCGRCRKIWHDDNCNEDIEIKNFSTNTGNIVKKCPSCKIWIEKNEGCNHITCGVCKYEWCWLCEEMHTPEHYSTVGTPCYNRQFNENHDPEVQRIIEMQHRYETLFNIFFVFMCTLLIIKLFSRLALRNAGNRERSSKMTILITFFIVAGFFWFISILFNGFIFMTMLNSLTKMTESRNNCAMLMCILTYIPLFLALYLPNILLSTIWFLFSNVASIVILCEA